MSTEEDRGLSVPRGRIETALKERWTAPEGLTLNRTQLDWRAAMQSTETEVWRPVPGWEDLYEVSDKGQVRSLTRVANGRTYPGRILKPWPLGRGHLQLHLARDGRRYARSIHTLVLEAFVGPRPAGTVGCHGDGNPANNAAMNLRWGTYADNEADKLRHGTRSRGSARPAAKLREQDIPEIRRRAHSGESYRSIAADYGVDGSLIGHVKNGKVWSHVDG